MAIWLIVFLLIALVLLIKVIRKFTHNGAQGNYFMRMHCSGTPNEAPLNEQQMHDILRQDFHPSKVPSNLDIIVIGSGLCGLTTAKILAAAGRKVLVLEQHDRAGGSCHTFELDRFEFDVGMHYALQMRPHNASHKICCAVTESQMTWQPIEDPFDVMIIGDKRYEHFGGNYNAFFKQLREWFPDESDKISAYEQHVGQCLGEAIWWFRIKFIPIFITRLLIKSGLLDLITKMRKHIGQTLQQSMQQFGFSKQLQAVCSYYCVNYGIQPNRASFLQHWLFFPKNGSFPVGGTAKMTSHIVRSIEKFAGSVLVRAEVKQIVFENGKVKGIRVNYGKSGYFIECATVISTVPLVRLFQDLLPKEIALKSDVSKAVNQLNAASSPKVAALQVYLGLNGSQEDLKLPSNNYFLYKSNEPTAADDYLRLSADEAIKYGCPPFIYVTFPSAKDPKWDDRHPGVSTCQLITITNPEWFEQFRDKSTKKSQKRLNKDDYLQLKNAFAEIMIERLSELFPQYAKEIIFSESSTSLSQQYYMQNDYGELYSLPHTVDRFKSDVWTELRHKCDIPGLILSGQDVMFCGVTSALHNGLLTAQAILKGDLLKDLDKAVRLQTENVKKSE